MKSALHLPCRRIFATLLLLSAALGAQNAAPPADELAASYRAAHDALARGDQAGAAAAYRSFLGQALHRAANARARAGDLADAANAFKEALEISPADPALLVDAAALRIDLGLFAEAESLLNESAKANPTDPRVQLLLGRALFEQDKFPAAKPHLEAAFTRNPDDAWFVLAVTDLKLQQADAARQVFRAMLPRLGDKARTHFRFGLACYNGDFPDEAVVELRNAIAQDRAAPDQHYYLALAYLGHNPEAGFDRAEPEFRAELAVDPNDFRSHYMLGYIASKRRQFAEAERELKRALDLQPQDANAMVLLGGVYVDAQRDRDAEPLLRAALAIYSRSAAENYEVVSAHYMLGRILQRAGRADEAAKELAVSEEIRKRLRAAAGATADERARMTPPRESNPSLAKPVSAEDRAQAAEYLKRLSPAIAEAYNNLGALAASQGKFADAVTDFQRAGTWDPALEGVDRNLGRAAFFAHNYDVAIAALQRHLRSHPDDAWAKQALEQSTKARPQ